MLGKKWLSSVLIFLVLPAGDSGCFPNVEEIDKAITEYRAKSTDSKRAEFVEGLLRSLSNPGGVEDDTRVRYAIKRLVREYEETHDEAILVAVDSTKIDGGFANFICEFYDQMTKDDKFIKRCQQDQEAMRAVERCIGISFSEEELKALIAR